MFLVVQFPFADVRQFVPDDTHRLTVPTWPNAADGKEFVRGYGPVSRRPRGGVDYWAGERLFCPTARTLRFAGSPRSLRVAVSGRPMPFDCEFRRFFTNGQALCRVEIGLTQRTDRATVSAGLKWVSRNGQFRGNQPLTAAECVDVVRGILTVTNSNVVIGDAIQSVTNTITQAPASDELKQALLQLTRTVEQMAAQLPKEKQQEVAQDLRTLTEETTKPAPRRAWYELSANGLIEAAQAVAGLGPPVVEAVKVVLGLVVGAVV